MLGHCYNINICCNVVDANADWYSIVQKATKLLRQNFHITHTTVQVEVYQEDLMTSCDQCLEPVNLKPCGTISDC